MASDEAIIEAASQQAQATISAATISAQGESTAAIQSRQVTIQVAQIQGEAQISSANIGSGADVQIAGIRAQTESAIAGIQATVSEITASVAAGAQTTSAQISANADAVVAGIRAQSDQFVATTNATAETARARSAADATLGAASIGATGQATAAGITAAAQTASEIARAGAQTQSASIAATATTTSATIDANSRIAVANAQGTFSTASATIDANSRTAAATTAANADRYGSDQQLAGVEAHEAAEDARLERKIGYAEFKFDEVFPFVQGVVGGIGSAGVPQTPGVRVLGPFISSRGVLSPAEVQSQVNAAWAKNDARTASQAFDVAAQLAGRGFSSNSPLAVAMQVGLFGQNLRANNDAATSLRIQAATANAAQILKGQELLQQQFFQANQIAVDSERNQVTRQVGILSAVAQMVGAVG